ncbi:MAG: hypothetical protein AAB225_26635 [Acidobacteriota bacterium]
MIPENLLASSGCFRNASHWSVQEPPTAPILTASPVPPKRAFGPRNNGFSSGLPQLERASNNVAPTTAATVTHQIFLGYLLADFMPAPAFA